MAKKIGVLTIHGMGSFGVDPPDDTGKPSYSKSLFDGVRQNIGAKLFDGNVAWREAVYSHVFEKNQDLYVKEIKKVLSVDKLRDLAVRNLGDPASYNASSAKNQIYKQVHDLVALAFASVRKKLDPGMPLIVLAHSLGGHVASNYLWDLQDANGNNPDGDVAALITFGCNLPLFLFGDKPSDIRAIGYPGASLDPKFRIEPWWRNFYDVDDPLGFPLGPIGKGYKELAASGSLSDAQINVGGLFTSWNLFSHTAYWEDPDFIRPVADVVRELL